MCCLFVRSIYCFFFNVYWCYKKIKVLILFYLSKNLNILVLVICYKLLKNFLLKEDKYSLRIVMNI